MDRALFEHCAKTGDLIQIFRGTYEHWAIYVGRNEVVHLIPSSDDLGLFGNLGMLMDSGKARVRRQKIWNVVRFDRFQINNLLDDKYEPRERHLIVRDACRMVGREVPYCVATRNCEHFVTWLRYGTAESRQVQTAAVIGGVAAAGIGIVALGATLLSLLNDEEKSEKERTPTWN